MAFGSHPVPPPFDPQDPKALRASAERNHRNNVGLTQDLAHIIGAIWSLVSWPVRTVLRLFRRSPQADER